MNKLKVVFLMLALLVAPVAPIVLGQQNLAEPNTERIKLEIARRFRDAKTNVSVKLRNGTEMKGRITAAAENMFTLKKNSGSKHDISYADVTRVKGQGLSKGAKFGILTGILAGAVIIGALISLKNIDPFKNGVLR